MLRIQPRVHSERSCKYISIFGSGEESMQLLTTEVNLYHAVNKYIAVKVSTLASCMEI